MLFRSVCLLYILNEMRRDFELEIYCVHVNHGIRGDEALRDERFCRELAKRLDVIYCSFEVSVPERAKEWKMTMEEAGRKVRYDAFNEVYNKVGANKIAVAHHQNDHLIC